MALSPAFATLKYACARAWDLGGRFPLLFAALSALFFAAERLGQPSAATDMAAVHRAVDAEIRQLAAPRTPTDALAPAVDAEIRRRALPPAGIGAFGAWLVRWDGPRRQAAARVARTLALALLCLAVSVALAAAVSFAGAAFSPWTALAGLPPAYALVLAFGEGLKGLRAGLLPLEIVAVLAIAAADGLLPQGARALARIRRRISARDFVDTLRQRLPAPRVERFVRRLSLIDYMPHLSARLAAVVGTLAIVGLVPGLYPGTVGGALDLRDPAVWLAQSLDLLWLLAGALLAFAWVVDLLHRRWQSDRKGIDRLSQVLHRARPQRLPWRALALAAGALALALAGVAVLHWRADTGEVLLAVGLSLSTALAAGALGMALAVGLGLLLPLWNPAPTALLLHALEAVPRVLGVAVAMTAFNLWGPESGPGTRWLVWSGLLGLFAGGEALRPLYGQTLFLRRVDFVEGMRSLGLGPWRIFVLHLWPQMRYRAYHAIVPVVQAAVYCEGAVCILRFAMRGTVLRLYPAGSLLAESVERFGFAQWQGALLGLGCIGLLVAVAALAARALQGIWYLLFLRGGDTPHAA